MFSRSDSIGGPHGPDDRLDMRVAFGEGFATALAGIVLNNPDYCDTLWSGNTLTGFRISAESHITSGSWYDELALMKIVYDLWDTVDDGLDDSSIGFGPIYDVMVGPQASNPAFTSIFTFAEALKQMGTGQNAFIDAQLAREGIVATGIEKYASTETDDLGGAEDVLPVYTPIVPDGSVTNICSNRQYDSNVSTPQANANKLSEHRFLRVTITEQRPYTFSVITTTVTPYANDPTSMQDQSDPDLYYYLNGQIQNLIVGGLGQGTSGDENQEVFTTPISLAPGDYVIDLLEWRYEDPDTPTGPLPDDQYPARTCFDFSITPS
jgi:hypothetical protein